VIVAAALAVGVAVVLYARAASDPVREGDDGDEAAVAAAPVDSALLRLDGLADTVERAVVSYADRAALFDRRRMECDELQRGLVRVEEAWMGYNVMGKARAPTLDAPRAQRDQGLYARVDSVDRHFERSGCVRP
jgi:hypothetical protein